MGKHNIKNGNHNDKAARKNQIIKKKPYQKNRKMKHLISNFNPLFADVIGKYLRFEDVATVRKVNKDLSETFDKNSYFYKSRSLHLKQIGDEWNSISQGLFENERYFECCKNISNNRCNVCKKKCDVSSDDDDYNNKCNWCSRPLHVNTKCAASCVGKWEAEANICKHHQVQCKECGQKFNDPTGGNQHSKNICSCDGCASRDGYDNAYVCDICKIECYKCKQISCTACYGYEVCMKCCLGWCCCECV